MIDLIAFLDTEASGLFRKNLPADDPSQPHLLQLSCKVVDGRGRRVSRFTRLVRPEGWTIEPEALEVHRITESLAMQAGTPLHMVMADLKASLENATEIVGFAIQQFDRPLIELELKRIGAEAQWWRSKMNRVTDLMEKAAPVVGLPPAYEGGGPKWPTLDEAVNYCRRREWERVSGMGIAAVLAETVYRGTHDAEEDAEATEELYWYLK